MSCNLFSNKIKTGSSDARNIESYLQRQGDNELPPVVLIGDLSEIIANDARSEFEGHASSHIHFQLTSRDPISADDLKVYIEEVLRGYGIDPENHSYVLVEHQKAREDGSGFDKHYHLLVAYTGLDGRAINTNDSYIKNETISRRVEMRLGRPLGNGKYSQAVFDHAVKTGDHELAAAITASGILDLPRPDARKTKIENQIEKRLEKQGLDIKPAAIRAAFQDVKALPEGPAKLAAVASLLRENGLELAVGDKASKITIQKDGHYVGTLDRFAGIRASGDERLHLINEITTAAAAIPAANPITNDNMEETNVERTTATTIRDGATTAAEPGAAPGTILGDEDKIAVSEDARRDQGRHDVDHTEDRQGIESGPEHAERHDRAAGPDRRNEGDSGRDAGHDQRPEQRSEPDQVGERLSSEDFGSAPGHSKSGTRAATPVTLNYLEVAQLNAAWAAKGIQKPDFRKALVKVDTRPISEVEPSKPALPPIDRLLSKFDQAVLQKSWNERRSELLGASSKLKKPFVKVDLSPVAGAVPARPAMPSTDTLLSKLQQSQLQSAWLRKRDEIIAKTARQPMARVNTGKAEAIKPTAPLPAAPVTRLPTAEVRKLFAEVKGLSGTAQQEAIAKLLSKHGLHLDVGAKSGVITINRRLSNGSSEFLGSLDRFAGLKATDAERGAVISSIMSKVSAQDVRPDQPPQQQRKETDLDVQIRKERRARAAALAGTKEGREVWQQYVAGIENKVGQVAEFKRIAASGYAPQRGREDGLDSDRAAPDQRLVDRDAEGKLGRRESGSTDAPRLRSDNRKDGEHREFGDRSPRDDDRPHQEQQRNEVGGRSDLRAKPSDLESLQASIDTLKSGISAAVGKHQFSKQTELRVDGWMMMTSKSEVKPTPAVDLSPKGKATSKRPSADIGHSAKMQPTLGLGGDFVTADFGGDDMDDETKKKKSQENWKRVQASLGPKM